MTKNIMIVGVGGQGSLLASKLLGHLLLSEGYDVKVSEVHGMSQRGGDVQSNLRISSSPIHSDLIALGGADLIISLEPMEALRYLPYLSMKGWIVTSTEPYVNIPHYPDKDLIFEDLKKVGNVIMVDVDSLAKEAGNPKGANIVLLGACAKLLDIEISKFEDGIRRIFARKGEDVVESNIKAFRAGVEAAVAQ